jgi:glycosyltransferase involved in cell wall biosynthesis
LKRLSVLNAITGLNIGGAEMMLSRFVGSLGPSHYEPSVLSLMTPGVVAGLLAENNVPVHTLGLVRSGLAIRGVMGLRGAFVRSEADIIHGWMYHGNLAASIGAMIHRRQPVVWSIHHSIDDISAEKSQTQRIIRLLAKCSGSVAAISYCSNAAASQHEALGFDPSKRAVIPNGVDCTFFRPDVSARARLVERYRIPAERLIVANVARAHPMKAHSMFVRVLAKLRDEGLDVHGLVVGAGHENAEARQAMDECAMRDRITMPGPVSDVERILPGIDIFLLSSAWGEAFPLSVAEAMACGIPCIVTDVGDCRWLVGDDALVASPRDVERLSAAVRQLAQITHEERQQIGLAGRRRVIDLFSLDQYTDRHVALYELAMSRKAIRETAA